MIWSWKIGTLRGIAVYVHATFLLLIGWILVSHLIAGHGASMALQGALFTVLLFGCVVLHEFGHALTAQRFGVQTRDITLYPIGGVARLEHIARDPRQELLIALAGPLVNVVIAAILFPGMAAAGTGASVGSVHMVGGNLAGNLMWVNLFLAGFNLLPAFPMDGGRVLRAFLATRMEYGHAIQTAAAVGQAMAFLFGFAGLFFNPFLLFIAFFVYMGAGQEAATVQVELAFRGVPIRDAMVTQFAVLAPGDSLSQAVNHLLAGAQTDFAVIQDGRVLGVLTRTALVTALAERGPTGNVGDAMLPPPPDVAPTDSLETGVQRLHLAEAPVLLVEEDGRLIGLLTPENVGEFLMIRTALQEKPRGLAAGQPRPDARQPGGADRNPGAVTGSAVGAPRHRLRGG